MDRISPRPNYSRIPLAQADAELNAHSKARASQNGQMQLPDFPYPYSQPHLSLKEKPLLGPFSYLTPRSIQNVCSAEAGPSR